MIFSGDLQVQTCERRRIDDFREWLELPSPDLLHPFFLPTGIRILGCQIRSTPTSHHAYPEYASHHRFAARDSTANTRLALFSTLSGLVVHWTGRYRECLLLGWAVWAIGLGLISTLDSPSLGKQIGYGLLAGLGLGNTLQPSLIAVQAGVERKHMAVVTSTRNFVRNLGGTLGLAISGTIVNNVVRHSLIPYGLSQSETQLVLDSPDLFRESFGQERTETIRAALISAYQQGFRIIFIVGAALNAVAFIAAWFMMPQVELNRKDDAQLKAEGKMRDEEKRKKTPEA